MTRLQVFLILSLSFAVSVQAQKVHRAAKAMYELKFDKSFDYTSENTNQLNKFQTINLLKPLIKKLNLY